jgi:hypothetical protein
MSKPGDIVLAETPVRWFASHAPPEDLRDFLVALPGGRHRIEALDLATFEKGGPPVLHAATGEVVARVVSLRPTTIGRDRAALAGELEWLRDESGRIRADAAGSRSIPEARKREIAAVAERVAAVRSQVAGDRDLRAGQLHLQLGWITPRGGAAVETIEPTADEIHRAWGHRLSARHCIVHRGARLVALLLALPRDPLLGERPDVALGDPERAIRGTSASLVEARLSPTRWRGDDATLPRMLSEAAATAESERRSA